MGILADIRVAMGAALNAMPGTQGSAYGLSLKTVPTAVVMPGPVEYHRSMQSGHTDWNMRVRVYVGTVDDQGAQKLLDEYLAETGDLSVKEVLEAYDGPWHDLTVEGCDGYQEYQAAGGDVYLGAEWSVLVLAQDN